GKVRPFRTDASGVFTLEFGEAPAIGAERKKGGPGVPERVELTLLEGVERIAVAHLDVVPEAIEADAPHPVGDVTFAAPTTIAEGTVVDDVGAPVRYARVEVEQLRDLTLLKQGENEASRDSALEAVADENGRFAVRGVRSARRYRLLPTRAGYRDGGRVEVEAGATDVRLTLRRGGVVEGRLLLDPDLPRDLVRATLHVRRAGANDGKSLFSRETSPAADGALAWIGAPEGVGMVVIRTHACGHRDFAKIDDIRIEAGGSSRDPRLDPLDLRGKFHVVELSVVGSDGRRLGEVEVETLDADGKPLSKRGADRGVTRLCLPFEPIDLRLWHPAYRPTFVARPFGAVRATLGSPFVVRLRAPQRLPALQGDVEYVVDLVPTAPQQGRDPGMRTLATQRVERIVAPGRDAVVRVGAPGEYAVQWRVERQRNKAIEAKNIEGPRPRDVVLVPDADVETTVDLRPPPEAAVQRAVQRLGP
ncbi:MAG TPA: carboxypeptidase-like regulatory domain-containing protein, partial [Planctomycetota bacterium]|nr:carboxypeptidase-like regulatory domain-containing protein [Planctomycetota bacterium]